MNAARLDALRRMVKASPHDPRTRYFLAHELHRAGAWGEAAEHYAAAIELGAHDPGTAYKGLGQCLERAGAPERAAEAYRRGVEAARAHGHEGLADEIEDLLNDLSP